MSPSSFTQGLQGFSFVKISPQISGDSLISADIRKYHKYLWFSNTYAVLFLVASDFHHQISADFLISALLSISNLSLIPLVSSKPQFTRCLFAAQYLSGQLIQCSSSKRRQSPETEFSAPGHSQPWLHFPATQGALTGWDKGVSVASVLVGVVTIPGEKVKPRAVASAVSDSSKSHEL